MCSCEPWRANGKLSMDERLEEALAIVLTDVRSTKTVEPEIIDRDPDKFEGYASAWLRWPSGSGQGFGVDPSWPMASRVVFVADTFQEAIVEELCARSRPATWPECPDHPDSHPLAPTMLGETATWVCPRTERPISEIGQLPQRLRRKAR